MTTADKLAVAMILAAAPAVTLFPIVYGLTSPWRRHLLGWGLLMSSTGLALLIDISLAYQWLGDDYALRDAVRLTVYALIVVGAWIMLAALVLVKVRAFREHRREDAL